MFPMMPYPYAELEFGKDGASRDAAQVQSLHQLIVATKITDLCLVSHGWNNDMAEARDLYSRLFDSIRREETSSGALGGRRVAVAGLLWPSKRFADASLIPGGAAGVRNDAAADQIINDQIA